MAKAFETRIKKDKGSLWLRIPEEVAEAMMLKGDQCVEVTVE